MANVKFSQIASGGAFNSATDQIITLRSGTTDLLTTPGSLGPGGSSGQIQWNNGGSFAGAVALVYTTSGNLLTATAQAATDIPIVAKGATSQVNPYLRCQTSTGVNTLEATSNGKLVLRNSANDGSRIGIFLTYDAGTGRVCDIASDDTVNSFTFNPSNSFNTIGASTVNADAFQNRTGGSSNPINLVYFNGNTGSVGASIENTETPGSAPVAGYLRYRSRNTAGTTIDVAKAGSILSDISASWKGGYQILVSDSVGADRVSFRANANGSAVEIGFFGTTPTVKPPNTDAIDTLLANLGLRSSGGSAFFDTDVKIQTVAKGLYIKEGTNGYQGVVTLSAGVGTVTITGIGSSTHRAQATRAVAAGTLGGGFIAVITANTLTITALQLAGTTQTLDTSTFTYNIFGIL